MRAPFPWFGGKSRASPEIWARFGNVPNYVEPFAGSLAVLLARPHAPGIETINDKDAFVANFWRALAADPDTVTRYADDPVNEADLHARHVWLVARREELTGRLEGDPDYYDPKIAGWWVWGQSVWIGSGWCSGEGPWWPDEDGVLRQRPQGNAGQGVNRKLPHLGDAGRGVKRQCDLLAYMQALADRLARVRVCCGDWTRVLGPSPTTKLGITGVLLDPPYSAEADRDMACYSVDCGSVAHECRAWCIRNGADPLLRIALCGYNTEHRELLEHGWTEFAWTAIGGYGSSYSGNKERERIWFSPACLQPVQELSLFDEEAS